MNGRNGSGDAGSIVHDGKATIDLRHRPTRADFAFPPGRNYRAFQSRAPGREIATTVILPTGALRIPAFVIAADGGDFTSRRPLPPKNIVVQRLFDDPAAARRSLLEDAPALAVDRDDVEALMARVAATAGTRAPQQGVLRGTAADWLAADAEVIGYEDGTVGVNYKFTVDAFGGAAARKVVHDGIFALDLTRRPSREELGFEPDAPTARVRPAPDSGLTVELTLPGGVIRRPVQSVDSTATGTIVTLTTSAVDDARRRLLDDAHALGVPRGEVVAFFDGEPGHRTATLRGHGTSVYDVTVTVDANLGQAGAFAAAVSYRFAYHG